MNPDRIVPTHKCRVCGALWRVNLERDTAESETWQLCSPESGKCCDNTYMGEQIVPATAEDVMTFLSNTEVCDR